MYIVPLGSFFCNHLRQLHTGEVMNICYDLVLNFRILYNTPSHYFTHISCCAYGPTVSHVNIAMLTDELTVKNIQQFVMRFYYFLLRLSRRVWNTHGLFLLA